MKTSTGVLAVALVVCACTGSFAQGSKSASTLTGMQQDAAMSREEALAMVRSLIQEARDTTVAENMWLTPDESRKFWPVYDEYQKAMQPVREQAVNLIISFAEKQRTLTDEDAKKMVDDMLKQQESENNVRRSFVKKFSAVLTGKQVARFYQIDSKINAEIRYELGMEIPLVKPDSK